MKRLKKRYALDVSDVSNAVEDIVGPYIQKNLNTLLNAVKDKYFDSTSGLYLFEYDKSNAEESFLFNIAPVFDHICNNAEYFGEQMHIDPQLMKMVAQYLDLSDYHYIMITGSIASMAYLNQDIGKIISSWNKDVAGDTLEEVASKIMNYIANNIDSLLNDVKESYYNRAMKQYVCCFDDEYNSFERNMRPILKHIFSDTDRIAKEIDVDIRLIEQLKQADNWLIYGNNGDQSQALNKKIIETITSYNLPAMMEKAEAMLNNDDQVGDQVKMDWTPIYDYAREAPIVVVDGKIYLGNKGDSHRSILLPLMKKNIATETTPIGFGYYINHLAYTLEGLKGQKMSAEELANILISDSRIKKVYTLPENGLATRLAKKR